MLWFITMLIEECLRNLYLLESLRHGSISHELVELGSSEYIDTSLYTEIFIDIIDAIKVSHFSDDEKTVLQFTVEGYNYSEISELTGINRVVVANIFASVCNKLAQILGSEYNTNLQELPNDY